MISGGVVGWEKAEDVPCSFLCTMPLYYKMIMQGTDRTREVRAGCVGDTCIIINLCQGLFFNKVAGLRPATLLRKTPWYRCFSVNFVKFLRTPFLTQHLWWLILRNLRKL